MSRLSYCFIAAFFTLAVSGCYMSTNGYLCALNEPEIYCDKKIRAVLLTPVKLIDDWAFSGRSEQTRLEDWVQCGGMWNGEYGGIRELPNGEKRTTQQVRAESRTLFYAIQRCMLKKGYEYVGLCYDSEISRAHPACRHRAGEPWE